MVRTTCPSGAGGKDINRVLEHLTGEPGIYVFARRWSTSFEALYVGQATSMAVRLKQQFNNHKLVQHILDAKVGAKVLLTGYLTYYGYTNVKKSLDTAERAYIRYCISQGHSLHNKLGTRLSTNEILSLGGVKRTLFPRKIDVESKS